MRFVSFVAAWMLLTSYSKSQTTGGPGSMQAQQPQTATAQPLQVGGEPPIRLERKATSHGAKPEFTSVTLLPGRGMNVYQITANIPGKGEIPLLSSPSLEDLAGRLNGTGRDQFGNSSFTFGGAFLIPYPNRVLGQLSADGQSITTSWQGHTLVLPANGRGPGMKMAVHGLILDSKAENLKTHTTPNGQTETAEIHAGDFGGHWLSSTNLSFAVALTADAVDVTITARNIGKETEPMAIGWHPYFVIPSGDRAQTRLHIPATMVAVANDAIPTGQLIPVEGTVYDYQSPSGVPLDDHALDTSFSHFKRTNGAIDVRITDPASKYGFRVEGISPQIQTVQIFAPKGRSVVAVEDQFNYADPFGAEWKGMDTGMVPLRPGQSVTWKVRVALFTPESE